MSERSELAHIESRGDASRARWTVEAAGQPLALFSDGDGPVCAVALHAGHRLRSGLQTYIALNDEELLREEDPYTADMAPLGIPLLSVVRSRFEVDLNRPRERAVYRGPDDAWGLDIYRQELPEAAREVSRGVHDVFYDAAFEYLSGISARHRRFVVLDLHSYNHRREGAEATPAPVDENPEVNLGTGWLDHSRWAPVTEGFQQVMCDSGFDCRENVKFRGGHFAHWVAQTFPDTGAVLAIEFKKTYMDEWTGQADQKAVTDIRVVLEAAVPVITLALDRVL